jgi:D-alanyl-D-alanine carboxypeptidase (penicillin-binding protein 5/6)
MKNKSGKYVSIILLIVILLGIWMPEINASAAAAVKAPVITGQSAVIIDVKSGRILYQKNPDKRVYPASTTKLLTALLAVENCDVKGKVTVGKEVSMIEQSSSKAYLRAGESMDLKTLLYGMLLPSGNDAANAVAVSTARKVTGKKTLGINESLSSFSALMNKRAKKLGAKGSNFVNPSGYHNQNHYSTARDMALIAREAYKYPMLRTIFSTAKFTGTGSISGKKINHYWTNTNYLINKNYKSYYYPYATGMKTGHTSYAGNCLVSSGKKGSAEIIVLVYKSTSSGIWKDSKALLDYGLKNYSRLIK